MRYFRVGIYYEIAMTLTLGSICYKHKFCVYTYRTVKFSARRTCLETLEIETFVGYLLGQTQWAVKMPVSEELRTLQICYTAQWKPRTVQKHVSDKCS